MHFLISRNRRTRRWTIILAVAGWLVSGTTYRATAWTRHLSFEHGTAGQRATGRNGFRDREAFESTVFSERHAYAGERSAASSIRAGQRGFGSWGAMLTFTEPVYETDSLWLLAHFLLPKDCDVGAEAPGIQLLRVNVESAGGVPEGSIDVRLDPKTRRLLVVNRAAGPGAAAGYEARPVGRPIELGEWTAIELHVRFAAQRGRGLVRVWQSAECVYEDRVTPTLRSPFSRSQSAYVLGYWPGGAPRSQALYVDEIVATTDTPAQRDRKGNARVWPSDAARPPDGLPQP